MCHESIQDPFILYTCSCSRYHEEESKMVAKVSGQTERTATYGTRSGLRSPCPMPTRILMTSRRSCGRGPPDRAPASSRKLPQRSLHRETRRESKPSLDLLQSASNMPTPLGPRRLEVEGRCFVGQAYHSLTKRRRYSIHQFLTFMLL